MKEAQNDLFNSTSKTSILHSRSIAQDRHVELVPCLECARLELRLKLAKNAKERAQWQKLITRHLEMK